MNNEFISVPVDLLKKQISVKAKICYILLDCFYKNDTYYIDFLKKNMKEKDYAIRRACKELKENNLLKGIKYRDKKSKKILGLFLIPMLKPNALQKAAEKLRYIESIGGEVIEWK